MWTEATLDTPIEAKKFRVSEDGFVSFEYAEGGVVTFFVNAGTVVESDIGKILSAGTTVSVVEVE